MITKTNLEITIINFLYHFFFYIIVFAVFCFGLFLLSLIFIAMYCYIEEGVKEFKRWKAKKNESKD